MFKHTSLILPPTAPMPGVGKRNKLLGASSSKLGQVRSKPQSDKPSLTRSNKLQASESPKKSRTTDRLYQTTMFKLIVHIVWVKTTFIQQNADKWLDWICFAYLFLSLFQCSFGLRNPEIISKGQTIRTLTIRQSKAAMQQSIAIAWLWKRWNKWNDDERASELMIQNMREG